MFSPGKWRTAEKRTDCFRVLVGVAVLQLDVDLVGAQVHERERLEVLARTDDEHGRAKSARIARRLHTRLDARALERELEPRRETRRRFDLGCDVFGLDAALDEDGLDAGDELLGKVEPGLGNVGNDDGGRACGVSGEETDKPDGSGAAA